MNKSFYLIPLLLITSTLSALPEGGEVAAGHAQFYSSDVHSLEITTSDKAIINYREFNIGEAEYVEFIQPSKNSTVLNRIKGGNPSKILGKLSSNGRIFLVNPKGIYFGPKATINTGSFLASTLNIHDQDFLEGRYRFFKESGSEKGFIVNDGVISSSPEGFIALFAPVIQNRGSILAKAGKVLLASAERVTLDFSGDGLIQFSVDGELKDALIENYGQIESASGSVELSMCTAQKAIKMVVNTDGLIQANEIEDVGGVIRLVSKSRIAADHVQVDAGAHGRVDAESLIDVSSLKPGKKGGTVHVLGESLHLSGAEINASGDAGGGTILIGGDYRGKGDVRTAFETIIDPHTTLLADALKTGDGGRVIVWADDTTLFDGKIFARGIAGGGRGGFVETSGKINLGIQTAYVDTSTPDGKFGNWLLDPDSITIATSGAGTIASGSAPNCATTGAVTISVATMQAAATNVALCAQNGATSSITVSNAFTMATGVSLSLTAGSGNAGNINLNANITTGGQPITLLGTIVLGAGVVLDTTNAGGSAAGANINITGTVNGAQSLTLRAGTGGGVTFTGAIGGTNPLTNLVFTSANNVQIGSNVTVTGANTLSFPIPVNLTGNSTITSNNANISFGSTLNKAQALTIAGGAGTTTFTGAVGGTTPLSSLSVTAATITQSSTAKTTGALSYTGSTAININGNQTTSGGVITMTGPVTITNTPTFDSTNTGGTAAGANISFSSTINGATALTLRAGTVGVVTFTGAVGGTNALTNLAFTSASTIQIGSNFTVTGANPLTFPRPVSLTGTSLITSNNANVSFSSTLNGAQSLTIAGGTGTTTFTGAVGGTTPLSSLSVTAATITQSSTAKTTGALSYTGTTAINLNGNQTTSGGVITMTGPVTITNTPTLDSTNAGGTAAGANISFSSTVDGATALTLQAGTGGIITFSGVVGGANPLTNLAFTSANTIQIGNNVTTTGASILSFSAPVTLTGTSIISNSSASSNIAFKTVDGPFSLTIVGGTGLTTFTAAVGGTSPLSSLSATASTITQSSTAVTTGALSYTASTSVNIRGNTTTSGGVITVTGPCIISSNPTLDTTNGGSVAAGANISFSSTLNSSALIASALTLQAGTGGIVSFNGAVGGANAFPNLIFTSANTIQVGSNITVTGVSPLTFSSPVSLTGTSVITSNNANIGFSSTLNGAQALTIVGGTGTTTFTGAVGGTVPLSSLSATAATVTQSSTAKATGALSYTGSTAINLGGSLTTSGGAITMTGSMILTSSSAFDTTNSGGTPAGSTISFSSDVTGTGLTLNLNAGTTGTISVGGILNVNTFVITNSAGTTVTGAATIPNLFITDSTGTIAFNGAITNSTSLSQTNPDAYLLAFNNGGTITPTNTFINTGGLTLNGGTTNLSFVGGFTYTAGATTIINTVKATNPGVSITTHNTTFGPGTTALITNGGAVGIGAATLSGNTTVDTTNAGGASVGANIVFSSTINGSQTLNLTAGTGGAVSFGAVGGATALTSLTATGLTVTQSSTVVTSQAISYTGTAATNAISLGGNLTTKTATTGTVSMTGTVLLPANVAVDTTNSGVVPAGSNITFSSTIDGAKTLTLTGGTGGAVSFGAVGATTPVTSLIASGVSIAQNSTVTSVGTVSYSGAASLGGNITVTGVGNVSINNGAVTLIGNSIIDTSANNGNITFGPSLATVNGNFNLSAKAGTGTVTFNQAIGNSTPLNGFTITSAGNANILSTISASTITQTAGTGTTTFGGAVSTSGAGGINLTGTNFTFNSTTTTTGGGPVAIANSGILSIPSGSNMSVAGSFTQSVGTGTTQLGANITTTNSAISIAGTLSLTSSVALNAGNGTITLSKTVDGTVANAQNLTLTAGSGNINFNGTAIGGGTALGAILINSAANVTANAITASSITQSAGTGTTTFNGVVDTNGASGISLTGTNFAINANVTTTNTGSLTIAHSGSLTIASGVTLSIDGSFVDSGSGTVSLAGNITSNGHNISFGTPVTLAGPVFLNTGASTGNILFSSTLDGAQNLTLNTGNGNVTFTDTVGGTTRLGILTINSTNNFTANALTLASFNQVSGTGITTFNGAIDSNTLAGLSITDANTTFNNSVNTTNGGPVSISVGGTLILSSSAVFTLTGAFTQSGVGGVQSAGSITTTNQTIQFGGAVALTGATVLSTGSGAGNILFLSTLDGPGALTLTAETGDITFSQAVGSLTRLGAFTINSATNISALAVTAASIDQIAASGTSTYNGNINTSTLAGVLLAGNIFSINGNLTTTAAGPFTITNAGLLTLTAGNSTSLSGAFTQNGTGAVNFSGTILTNNAAISFARPITLSGAAILNTGTGAGSITLSSTVDGTVGYAQALTLTSGTGNTILGGNIGSTVPLSAMSINQAANVSTQAITASSLTQLLGSGTTTFNGAIDTNTLTGINLTGTAFTFNNNVTTTASGPLTVANNSGVLTFAPGIICSIDGAVSQTGSGSVSLAGQITAGGAISIAGQITVSGTASLSTAAASQNITLSSTIDGANNLTLAAGGGNITFGDTVGGTTRLGNLTFSSAHDITTHGITAANISQLVGTGTTTFDGGSGSSLNTNGGTGINLTLTNFSRDGSIVTTNGGNVVLLNSGTVTLISPVSTSISGFFQQNGAAGSVNLSGTITTSNNQILFTSPITLTGSATLNSGSGAGDISLFTVTGAQTLTLIAGTGSITTSTIGAIPLTTVTFTSANNITTGAISAQNIIQTAGSGTSIFNGALSTTTASGISLSGTSFQFPFSVTTTGTGPFSLNNSGSAIFGPGVTFSISGGFSQTGAGAISLGANITTNSEAISFASAVTLNGASVLDSSTGNGNITFSSTLDGSHTLSMTGGSGSVSVGGTIGAVLPLSSLTVVSANNITVANIGTVEVAGVTGATSLPATTNLNFSGTNYNLNAQTLSGSTANFNAGALTTFTTNGNPITFSVSTMQLGSGTNLTVNSTGGAVTLAPLHAVASNLRTLTVNAGTGAIQVAQIGTVNNAEFAGISLTGGNILIRGDLFSNALTLSSSGVHQIFLGGNITTVNGAVSFPVAVVRDTITTATVSTGTSGDITFSSTIDADVPLTRNLTLAAGGGNITLTGAVGGVTPLETLTITSANNVTASAITVGLLVQNSGTGTTTFNGALSTSNALGIDLIGSAFTFNNTVTTTTGGPLQINNTGLLSMPSGANCTLSGPFSQTGSGAVQIGNTITGGEILFTSAISLTHATSLSTEVANQPMTFMSSIDSLSTTPFDLFIESGSSPILISGDVGSIHPLGAITIDDAQNITTQAITSSLLLLNSGTGTTTINGNVLVGSGGINLSGVNFAFDGSLLTTTSGGNIVLNNSGTATMAAGSLTTCDGNYSQIGTGPVFAGGTTIVHGNLLITSPVTVFSPATYDLSIGGGSMTFLSTIDGGFNFSLLSSGGAISIGGDIGTGVPVNALSISGAGTVTTQGIQATSIAETTGTGTTTFNGALITTGIAGISITTNSVVRGAAITATGGGPLTITIANSGTFTSTAAGNINLTGGFTQNGTGAVSLGGFIFTSDQSISFAGPITLAASTTLDAGSLGPGDIILSQTVQGAFSLTLNGGIGNVVLGGNVGTVNALTSLSILTALNVTTQAITAGSISQSAGTGTTTFNGVLNTTGGSGISLTGTSFTFNSPFATTGGGPLSVTNSGLLTFAVGATGSLSGALTQNGSGSTQLSSSITSGGAMQFNGPFTVSGTGSLSTSAANLPITFFSTVDGPGNLTLSSGTAAITISGNAGSLTPLGTLTISTVGNLTTQAVTAAALTQSAGTGTTLLNGNINTSGSGGIHLTGPAFTFLQNMTTTGAGPISITNSGFLTTTAGKTISSNGIFTQNGAGSISLAGTITTTNIVPANAAINFSGTSPITLIASSIIDSSIGGGTITLSAGVTVDGHQAITLASGTGDINILGAIGGITRIGAFTVTSAQDVQVETISANSITQLAGSGITSLLGAINTDAPAGITLIGNNFLTGPLATSITTTNGGSLTITNQGLVSEQAPLTISLDGSFIQNGPGPIYVGSITARQGISFTGPATIPTTITLDSSGGGGNILFSNTVNGFAGTENLILNPGTGSITFSSAVGGLTPLGALTIVSANNVTTSSISAGQISGSSILGLATFNGSLTTSTAAGIILSGSAFTFNNTVTTTGGGVVTLTNSGALTIANGVLFNLDGAFTQTGAGSVSFGGSITTTNDLISFASSMALTAPASINSGAGAGDITLSGAVNGATTLSVTAGTGSVAFQSSIGNTTPLTALTIPSATNVLMNADATISGPFTLTLATGSTTFNGTLTATTISSTGAAINFNNAVSTSSGAIAITNSGTLTVASTAPITSSTSFIQTGAGTVSLGSNITTAGTLSVASPITLTNGVILNSGGGSLTLSGTVSGVFNLTLTAGTGDVVLASAVGAPRIGAFTVTSAHDLSVQAITASSISQQSGTGTSTLNGNLDTNTNTGITLIGTNFTSSGTVNTTNGGPLTITNSGLVTATGASTITLDGAFTQNGTGPVNVGGSITTNNANISHSSAVSVLLPAIFTSNGGNITFLNTVDGPACLTLVASTGNVTFNAAVGGTTPLGCLIASGATILQNSSLTTTGAVQETAATAIQLSGNVTTNANNITLTGSVTTMASLTLSTGVGAGDISISGTVNGNVAGYNLSMQAGTGNITLSSPIGSSTGFQNLTLGANNISWAGLGSTIVGATGLTSLSATTNINFTGITYNSGSQVYTAGSAFNFTAGLATTVSSPSLPVTFTTGTINLSNDLTLDTDGNIVTMGNLLGTGFNFTVDVGAGTYNFVQIGAPGQLLNNVDLTATTFNPTPVLNTNVFANSLTISSITPLLISTNQLIANTTYNQPVIIQGNIVYSCGSAGTITFNRTLDATTAGVDALTFQFNPCTGSVVFNSAVGSTTPFASISIDSATDVTVNSTMNTGEFLITNGTGTTSINTGITSTAAGGISITTPVISLMGAISTASGGPLVLDNSGTLTVAAGTTFDISGAFQQTGAGAVSIGGTVITHDSTIQFTGPITLSGDMTLNSNVLTGGDVSFASTIQGAFNLTVVAGDHDITFGGAVGTLATPLVNLQITSARNVTASAAIFAATITQLAGTGTTSWNTLNTSGLNGINVSGSAFSFNNNITTTGGGPLLINNSGALTFANATYSIAGALTQTGLGSTTMAGTFSTGGAISFARGVTLSGTTSLDTAANGQNITFSSILTNDLLGPHDLALSVGTGSITFVGAVGSTPIGALTISNANNVTVGAISATSIAQSAGTGTTAVSGNMMTSGGTGISLVGTNFTINSTVTTTGLGPFSITNSGPLSLTLGNSTSIAGAFTQSGGGAVSLSGSVTTVNQNLSFANAITLTGPTTLSTGSGAGSITLFSTVDGGQPLNLTAGTGNINFGPSLGASTPLGALTISSVADITYPLVNAVSIAQSASTGTTTITGPFSTTGALGVSIHGGVINQNGTITTANGGPVALTNTGTLTIGIGATTSSASSYTQSGGGAVNLGGSIQVANNTISFAGAITLTADIVLNGGLTSSSNIHILSASTIMGAHALTLTAPGGSISLSGNVGTVGTPLTGFTITNVDTASTQGIASAFISQAAGTGTTTFNGSLSTTTGAGISLMGNNFTFNNSFTTAAGGPLNSTNTGVLTFAAGAVGSVSGSLTQSGGGTTQLSSTITAGGAMQFNGAFSVSGIGTLSTSATNQPISFFSTLDGPGNLTLSTGTADILISGNTGSSISLGTLTISTVRNLTAQAITASALTQTIGTGTSLFNGAIATTGGGGIHLTGSVFTFLENITTTGAGPISIVNSGTLTTTSGKTLSSNGVFTQNGSGNVLLGSTIATTNATAANASINFSGTSPITLTAPSAINSSIGGGAISFSAASTVDGSQSINLIAGTGSITIGGAFGGVTRLGAFTITSASNVSVQAITANTITQSAGTGTSSLLGSLNTNAPGGITLVGNNFTIGPLVGSITTTNGGSFVLTNQGVATEMALVTITIDGSYSQNGPGIIFVGPITAHDGISFTGPAIVNFSGTLDSSGGNGNIVFSNVVCGLAGTENLVLNAGTGDVTFSQSIGAQTVIGPYSVTAIGSLTATADAISIASVGTALAQGVNGSISLTAGSGMSFAGTIYNASAQTYIATSAFAFDMTAGALTTFSSHGSAITFQGGLEVLLSAGTDLTINTGGANLTLGTIHAQAGNHRALVLNAGVGSIQVGDFGTMGAGEFASASLTATNLTLGHEFADSFTFNYTGTLNATGDIVSTDTAITFPSTVILDQSCIFSTVGSTGAAITFSGTLDGVVSDTFGLELNAGVGAITFAQNVGVTHHLSNLTIDSAGDVTLAAPATMVVDFLSQLAGTGTTTFNGILNVPNTLGISLTGHNFTFNNVVQTSSNGSLMVANSGILTFAGSASLSGAFTQTGSGSVALSGSITASQPILFSGSTTLSGNPSLDTSAANQSITFQNTLNGLGNITFAAGGGDVTLQLDAGLVSRLGTIMINSAHGITAQSVSASALHVVSSTGTATINGALNTNGAAGIILVGNNFTLNGSLVTTNGGSVVVTNSGLVTGFAINSRTVDGSYTQNGTGPVNFAGSLTTHTGPISFSSSVILLAASIFDSSAGNSNITFSNTVDGPGSLSVSSGGGNILFNQNIGASTVLGAITIPTAHNVNMQIVDAASLTQSAGTGTTTLSGNLTTNGLSGISLTGTNFIRGASWTTTNAGPVTVNNSGLFTSTAAGTIVSAGAFNQSGAGAVSISGSLSTGNAAITFHGPMTLAGNMAFNSGVGTGAMTFNNTVDAAADSVQTLTLTSGAGNISFQAGVGSGTRLSTVTVTSANDVTFNGLKATTFVQGLGSGTTTLNGITNTNAAGGIQIKTSGITLNNTVTTTNNGPIILTNAGLLTVAATCTVSGAFTQNGLGTSSVSGSVTSGGQIFFKEGVVVSGSPALTAFSQLITLSSTLDGPGNLSLNSGAADIILGGVAGAVTRLGALTFINANNITTSSMTATSITQVAGAGTTAITGDLNTSGASGIHLTGVTFALDGSVITTGGGPVVINHTLPSSFIFGPSTLISGPFSELGTGLISLEGILHANNANITFTNALSLTGATILDSDGGGDILISSAVDGNVDLDLIAGTGNITILADIGGVSPPNSFTIESANNVTTQAIYADQITQVAGSGLTTFNGVLETSHSSGINLTGTQFTFNAPVITLSNGPVQITNSGLLTIAIGAPFNLTGPFSQLGLGNVSLSDNITPPGNFIFFTGAVTLGNDIALDTGPGTANITFLRTVGGLQNLTLTADLGTITFSQNVGTINALQVNTASTFSAQSITADSINLSGISTQATINGNLNTSGPAGITMTGAAFTILGNATTLAGGPFTITNSGQLIFASNFNFSLGGPFLQNGSGNVSGGGTLTTNNQPIEFQTPLTLTGNLSLNSGSTGAAVTLSSVQGAFDFTIAAGVGNVLCNQVIGDVIALHNFTVSSAYNIQLSGIGTAATGVTGILNLIASHDIIMTNTLYSANTQIYSAGHEVRFYNGIQTNLTSFGGPITFTSGLIRLGIANDLQMITNNGNFSFVSLLGTNFENIIVSTGTGTAALGIIASLGTINNLFVNAGKITISGFIDPVNTNFVSLTDIMNTAGPNLITCLNTPSFNALGGDVGSLTSPLLVQSSNQIFAGADGHANSLADFDGTSFDNTVHPIPSNPPCQIIFNGVVIKNCTLPPIPPTPPTPPGKIKVKIPRFPFAMPGFDSSQFNLASDYFFFFYFFDETYVVCKDAPMYWSARSSQ